MARNIISGIALGAHKSSAQSDGSWLCEAATDHHDVIYVYADLGSAQVATTWHTSVAIGAAGADLDANKLRVWLLLRDSAGGTSYPSVAGTGTIGKGEWCRIDGDVAVPSGSSVVGWGLAVDSGATAFYAYGPSLSVGGPVVLATCCQQTYATTTQLTQTVDGFERSITKVQSRVDSAYDMAYVASHNLAREIEARRSWFRESEVDGKPALTLGTTASKRVGVLTNEGLDFVNGDAVVARVGDHFYQQSAKVTGELLMGGFRASPRSDGGVSVKWIGMSG